MGAGAMSALVKYEAMLHAIALAYEVDEVKDIRDKAAALEHYARQANNIEAERQATEIRLRAERKAGQLLAQMEKNKGGGDRKSDHRSYGTTGDQQTLASLGISRDQSSQWQKLGAVPDNEFDQAMKEAERPTTNGMLRATQEPKVNPVSGEALWLWGRLDDFKKILLGKNQGEIMQTMTPLMKDDVHIKAPRVAEWLNQIGRSK
jgi:hypothetical protein